MPPRVRGDLAIALVTDHHIRKLNERYRRMDATTDVLSFPALGRPPAPAEGRDPSSDALLGDIVIATGVAKRQARAAGHSYGTELRVLALHGLLHLLGFDHDHPADSGRMARAEARLRRKGGLVEGLIARSGAGAARVSPARRKA